MFPLRSTRVNLTYYNFEQYIQGVGDGWLGFPDLWSGQKIPMELIFNHCDEFRWSLEDPVRQIHSPNLHVGATGIFSDLLRSVQVLKRGWGAGTNWKLPHLFIPSKTATSVPEFAVEDLSLSRTAALVPQFAVKDRPLGRTLWGRQTGCSEIPITNFYDLLSSGVAWWRQRVFCAAVSMQLLDLGPILVAYKQVQNTHLRHHATSTVVEETG